MYAQLVARQKQRRAGSGSWGALAPGGAKNGTKIMPFYIFHFVVIISSQSAAELRPLQLSFCHTFHLLELVEWVQLLIVKIMVDLLSSLFPVHPFLGTRALPFYELTTYVHRYEFMASFFITIYLPENGINQPKPHKYLQYHTQGDKKSCRLPHLK